MQQLVWIALGGMAGALARYGAGAFFAGCAGRAFPWATLAVNLLGCFMVGLAGQRLLFLEATAPEGFHELLEWRLIRYGILIGFLGSLTTFSAFGWETFTRLQTGRLDDLLHALGNVGANVLLGLLSVWAGAALQRALA